MTEQSKYWYFSAAGVARMAVLIAISLILIYFEIPVMSFYKMDLSNLPIMLGGFAMGPIPAAIMLLLKNLLHFLVKGSSSAGIGELADLVMGLAFVMPASIIYHRNKTRGTAVAGMAVGTLCMIVIGVFMNKYVLIPFYMGSYHMSIDDILSYKMTIPGIDSEWKFLLLITAPFNLIKGAVTALVTGLIYKPLSPLLKGKRFR